ncbi:hypothetical protein SLS58_002815 [Diplodia intermedia]|uniref:Uncharacterized protein n=1 Tax=Diplodia intermedia TaxID=856260 RepID=A0ABR3TXQ1_9PEZI
MDVYGAFQLCSIGILAAQVTARKSRTYFNAPGRNTIFLWTGLIFAGLLSLTVEFCRIKTWHCTHDDSGNPISSNAAAFPYTADPKCNLTCSTDKGPYSPLRRGSANNIYVIPAPDHFTFGTAMLLAAACCIPAILSLMAMWNKILKLDWNMRFGRRDEDRDDNEQIDGTNGATIKKMKLINDVVKGLLGTVEIFVFGGAVLAIIIFGERNFFSSQVNYMTEPIASIGQWAPIVGTGLAAIGSLYLLLAKDVKQESGSDASTHDDNASSQHVTRPPSRPVDIRPPSSDEPPPTNGRRHSQATVEGHRRKVTRALMALGNYFGTVDYSTFDDSEFRRGDASEYPQVPGEENRNPALPRIKLQYGSHQDGGGSVAPTPREQRSRAGSISSRLGAERGSATSPQRPDVHIGTSSSCAGSAGDALMLEVPPQVHHAS